MKRPIIYSVTENGEWAPIFSQANYDVYVGALEENKLPTYVVINRDTGVVEFTHEVTAGYKSFLDQVAPQVAQEKQLGQLSLGLRN